MAEATFHFVQHTFTQRTVRKTQFADRQGIKHAAQNREARHKYGLTLVGKPRQAERIETLVFQNLFAQHFQAFRGDKTVFFAHRQQHFVRGLDTAGCA
ncbi:hypothetical protein D3C72_2240500 [compost metagenome]